MVEKITTGAASPAVGEVGVEILNGLITVGQDRGVSVERAVPRVDDALVWFPWTAFAGADDSAMQRELP